MKIKLFLTLFAVLSALAFSKPLMAADYKIDPAHVSAVFKINHLGYSDMWGRFNDVSGDFSFDQENVDDAKVSVNIKTGTVDTNHEKRDEHLRSPDFLNAVEFPEMTFVSTKVEKTGDNTGKIMGDFTLLGITKPLTLDVVFNKAAIHPFDGKKPEDEQRFIAGFSATTKIKRSDFGMKYALPAIGDEIEIFLEVEGVRE